MQFDVVSLFPEMFAALTQSGVTRRAFEQERWGLTLWNPRDFTLDRHRTVDDRPYGGGPGMVMLAKPLEATINAAKARQVEHGLPPPRVVFMSPQGKPLTHERVMALKDEPGLVVLCGRYEAVDQRLLDRMVDEEISLGDFVLSGGELPAMAMMDLGMGKARTSNGCSNCARPFVLHCTKHCHPIYKWAYSLRYCPQA
jgi:tRNA (guanine37-N1)-methyltransferase